MKRYVVSYTLLPCCMDVADCFARNENGKCTCLADMDFGGRACPFYKGAEQNEQERETALQQLRKLGRDDLIEKYHLEQKLPDAEEGDPDD